MSTFSTLMEQTNSSINLSANNTSQVATISAQSLGKVINKTLKIGDSLFKNTTASQNSTIDFH
jgi:hypothetical protein